MIDKRSDVWAFGCVLYEMFTGKRAFPGEDVSDTLATVLKSEPDWNALPSSVPHAVRTLMQGCLRKDRKERIGDISTALFLLGQPEEQRRTGQPFSAVVGLATRDARRCRSVDLGGRLAATAVWQLRPLRSCPGDSIHAHAARGTSQLTLNRRAVAMSPDGTRMVYAAVGDCISGPCRSSSAGRFPEQTRRQPGVLARRPIAGVLGGDS